MSAHDQQVGGDHYRKMKIQPVEFICANEIPYLEGNIIKYVTRHRAKGGRQDLEKARHHIDLLLEREYPPQPLEDVRRAAFAASPGTEDLQREIIEMKRSRRP